MKSTHDVTRKTDLQRKYCTVKCTWLYNLHWIYTLHMISHSVYELYCDVKCTFLYFRQFILQMPNIKQQKLIHNYKLKEN